MFVQLLKLHPTPEKKSDDIPLCPLISYVGSFQYKYSVNRQYQFQFSTTTRQKNNVQTKIPSFIQEL